MKTTATNKSTAPRATVRSLVERPFVTGCLCGLAALIWRIPFIVRYDLHFQSDFALFYLMSKRILVGEFPLYAWHQDYDGTLPQFMTAGFFALFGSSIVLAGIVTACFWAVAIGLATEFVRRFFAASTAVWAGIVMVVGMPYFHQYATMPAESTYTLSIPLLFVFFWWVCRACNEGVSVRRVALLGGVLGMCWYLSKQVIIPVAAIFIAVVLTKDGRRLLGKLARAKLLVVFVIAFAVGYSPEGIYLLRKTARPESTRKVLGMASPQRLSDNIYWLMRSIPAYFDGDPLARTPEGVHYLSRNENVESFPRSSLDFAAVATAVVTLIVIAIYLADSFRKGNLPRLMLALYPFVNMAVIVFAKTSGGNYYSVRRYLYGCALVFPLWMGIIVATCVRRRIWPGVILMCLTISLSVFHQLQMLRLPDELKNYRAVVADLSAHDERYGLSWYSIAFVLTALSNEETIFATIDYGNYGVYQKVVMEQNHIALVYPSHLGTVPERITLQQKQYTRVGSPRMHGELSVASYQRLEGS